MNLYRLFWNARLSFLCIFSCFSLGYSNPLLARAAASSPNVYHWSHNTALSPAEAGRQSGETALVTDVHGVVWISFLEAEYHKLPNQKWVDWPRHVVLLASHDHGKHFSDRRVIGDPGGDEALAADPQGNVFATWIQYQFDDRHQLLQRPVLETVSGPQAATTFTPTINWDPSKKFDQSSVYIGRDNTLHVLATDITQPIPFHHPGPPGFGHFPPRGPQFEEADRPTAQNGIHLQVLYAQSHDGGRTFVAQQRLDTVGQLPQIATTLSGLFIVGPHVYLVSHDNGNSFELAYSRPFAERLARIAVSRDHARLFVVGDSNAGGLWLQSTQDGGLSWKSTRIDTGDRASAWRYPAIHVDGRGRLHVVWMDDRDGQAAIYNAYSDDNGASFSTNSRVSDQPFPFPSDAPPPAPANQNGTWIGDYLSITSVADDIVVAWSDQRTGTSQSTVYTAVGSLH